MNFYENLVILDPNLDEKATEEAVERVKNIIIKKGGDVLKSENWGHRKLAFDIKKHKKGTYVLIIFKAPPSTIAELEKFYKVFDLALKFMVIKLGRKEIDKIMSPQPTVQAEAKPSDSDKPEPVLDLPTGQAGLTLREKEDKGV